MEINTCQLTFIVNMDSLAFPTSENEMDVSDISFAKDKNK